MGLPIRRLFILVLIASAVAMGGCRRPPNLGVTTLKPATLAELQEELTRRQVDLDLFGLSGPFAVSDEKDFAIQLSMTERINADLFFAKHGDKAPLVIIQHGFDSSKDNHAYQAMHLASWGMHSLVLQLPNKGPWIGNGRTLAKVIQFIHRWPEIFDQRVDVNRIVLVGHSFGGAAAAVALAEGAPAIGAILLDPATINRDMPKYLSQIKKPVLILGADERLFEARNRDYFYRHVRSGVGEISINGALHEDAQFPSDSAQAKEESQIAYMKAMTSAAFSLSSTGRFDYAWATFGTELGKGNLLNAKKK